MALTKTEKKQSGRFDKRVTFQNYVESGGDGMGGSEGSYQDIADLWAHITPVSGSEKLRLMSQDVTISHIIKLRYNELDISGQTRIVWGDRKFNIKYVINEGEDNAYFELAASEEV